MESIAIVVLGVIVIAQMVIQYKKDVLTVRASKATTLSQLDYKEPKAVKEEVSDIVPIEEMPDNLTGEL